MLDWIEAEFPWLLYGFIFAFGACVGSFLNVCILRLPKEESIVSPPSHSVDGRKLSWWENIPIISWLILGGKDRVTGKPYGFRYLGIELLTGLLFLWVWLVHLPVVALVGMLFVSMLIVCTFIDLEHMILPDTCTIGGCIIGVFLSFWVPEMHLDCATADYLSLGAASGIIALISALVGAGLVFWIGEIGEVVFRKPAMGLGDVKLVGCIGAFCGWEGAIFSLFGGAIIGSVVLLPILIFSKSRAKKAATTEENEGPSGFGVEVPFGPMLALGGLVYFLGASRWVDPYFGVLNEIFFG